jgi:hypothetical protein
MNGSTSGCPICEISFKKHPTTNILLFHPSGFERESSGSEQAHRAIAFVYNSIATATRLPYTKAGELA